MAHTQEEETNNKREGDALLSKWTRCEMEAADILGRTTKMAPADGVKLALQTCTKERELWVDNQTEFGIQRYIVENVADGSERCMFPILEAELEMGRRNATAAERQAWRAANANYSCDK